MLGAALDEFDVRDLDDAVRAGVIEIAGERVRFTHPLLASVHYASVPARRAARAAFAPGRRRVGPGGAGACTSRSAQRRRTRRSQRARARGRACGPARRARGCRGPARARDPADAGRRTTRRGGRARPPRPSSTTPPATLSKRAALLEQLLLEQPGGRISARARLRLAMVRTDDFEFGASMLQQALLDAGDDDRLITRDRARLQRLVARTWVTTRARSNARRRRSRAPSASESRDRSRRRWPRSARVCSIAGQGFRDDLFERAIELERSAGDASPTFYLPSTIYGTLLRIENDLAAARPLLEGAVARARQRGEEGDALIPLLVRLARLESEAGDPRRRTDGSPRPPKRRASRSTTRWIRGSPTLRRDRREPGPARASALARRRGAQPRERKPRCPDAAKWGGVARGHRAVERRAGGRAPAATAVA